MVEICQVRSTRHKFLNYYTPDVIFDIPADIIREALIKCPLLHGNVQKETETDYDFMRFGDSVHRTQSPEAVNSLHKSLHRYYLKDLNRNYSRAVII